MFLLNALVLNSQVEASEKTLSFKYHTVFECGGDKPFDTLEGTHLTRSSKYYIHYGENDEIIIFTNGHQFKSFEKTHVSQLFVHNGGTFSLTYQQDGDLFEFEMKRDQQKVLPVKGYYLDIMIFARNSLTYKVRTLIKDSNDNTISALAVRSGFCWKRKLS